MYVCMLLWIEYLLSDLNKVLKGVFAVFRCRFFLFPFSNIPKLGLIF